MIIVDVKIESISRIRYVLQIRISSKLMMTGIYLNTADLESTDKLQKRATDLLCVVWLVIRYRAYRKFAACGKL